MSHKLKFTKGILYRFYITEKKSTHKIARMFNCDATTIARHLRNNKIKLRPPKLKIQISKEKLVDLYLNKKLSTYRIAEMYGCNANVVLNRLQEYDIQERPLKPEEVKITKRQLEQHYLRQKLPMNKIAKIFGCNATTVFKKMKQSRIVSRTTSEACTRYPKKDFSNNLEEKAYLLGFRTGDLRVRYAHKSSKLIQAGCGTTKNEQIDLIKSLFEKYGHGYISYSKKYRSWNIDFILNETFNFLLNKLQSIPNWILDNEKLFWAFVAGYTDAEGSIGIYQNMAKLRIGSYDQKILSQIHKKFRSVCILSRFGLETPAGPGHNQDFWRIRVSEKNSLLKLLNILEKYLKHSKRRRDLEGAKINLLARLK